MNLFGLWYAFARTPIPFYLEAQINNVIFKEWKLLLFAKFFSSCLKKREL